jgi:hypothetical protein
VLVRGYSWVVYLFLLIPLVLAGVGAGGVIYCLAGARKRAARDEAAPVGWPGRADAPPAEEYPAVPDPPPAAPGAALAVRLPPGESERAALAGSLAVLLGWCASAAVFLGIAYLDQQPRLWPPELCFGAIVLVVLLMTAVVLSWFVRRLLIFVGVGPTEVELSHHPIRPGERARFLVRQAGRRPLPYLAVRLVCEEAATYRQGTDTRTETKCVFRQELLTADDVPVGPDQPYEAAGELEVPAEVMHSFRAAHNEVRWKVVVNGKVPGVPAFERDFPLVVLPPRPGGEAP